MAEKTEQPTDKKRRDAQRDGQVAHSQDVGQWVGFLGAFLFFWVAGDNLLAGLARIMSAPSQMPAGSLFGQQCLWLLRRCAQEIATVFAPLFAALLCAGIAGDVMQNGPLFTPKRIKPSFSKLNVWSNIKSRFALPALVDLAKMVTKTVVTMSTAFLAIRAGVEQIVRLCTAPPQAAWQLLGTLLRDVSLLILAMLLPVALLDRYWQRAQLTKKLKMSIDEVRREYKETEGTPEIKGERRRRHEELSTEQIRARVKRSSVVVVNPVHYAVGLRYESGVTPLPVVTFKDFGNAVPGIRRFARREGVPVIRYPALARALYSDAVVDRSIPAAHIEGVAQIISMALREAAAARPDRDDRHVGTPSRDTSMPTPVPPRDVPTIDTKGDNA